MTKWIRTLILSQSLALSLTLSLLLSSCGSFPSKVDVKADHFRLENFKRDVSNETGELTEHVYLMCFNKKPSTWYQPRQYLKGEHQLWVKANISRSNIEHSNKVATVKFEVTLAPEKSYMLNREIVGDNIELWIQEVETGAKVSEVLIAELRRPKVNAYQIERSKCEAGSI